MADLGEDGYEKGKQKIADGMKSIGDSLKGGLADWNRYIGLDSVADYFAGDKSLGEAVLGVRDTLSQMATEAADATDGLGDLAARGRVAKAMADALAEAVKGLNDEFANISPQAITLNDNLLKMADTIRASIEGTEGFSFEGRLTRLTTQVENFREQLEGMKDLDPEFASIIKDNINQVIGLIDQLKSEGVDKEFEKIQKRALDVALALEKWVEPMTQKEKMVQAIREVDLQYQKFQLTITKQIEDLERLNSIRPLTPEQMEELERLRKMLITLEEQYQEVLKQTKYEYDQARDAAKEFADSIQSSVTDSLASAIEGLVNGTKSLRDVLLSLYADITAAAARYIAKLLIIKALNTFAPGAGDLFSAIMPNANGNAFAGNIKPFANGDIIRGPTLFGLAGEAGTEAIMPLKRVNGKLGVAAEGAGGGDTYNITIKAIDTQSAVQFLQTNADHLVGILGGRNNLNRGTRRSR